MWRAVEPTIVVSAPRPARPDRGYTRPMTTRRLDTAGVHPGAILLLLMLLMTTARAQDPPTTPTPAEPGSEQAPSAPADAPPATIPSDLERLAEALPEEHRVLKAGEESFDVFVRSITGGPAKGALVLIPGDGELPPTSEGLGTLRKELTAYGWSTWLISVQRPPRVQAITSAPATAGNAEAPTAPEKPAEQPKTEGNADTTKTPAIQEPDFPEPAASPGLDAQIATRMQDWIAAAQPRIAAVVAEAGKEGPVTLVAEGAASALVTGFMASGGAGVTGLVLIDPVEVQGAGNIWPEGLPTPVLEILDAETRADMGRERRTRANASKLASYRQLTLPGGYRTEEGQPSVLARRIRGWLLTLPQSPPPTPRAPAASGPEALGPNRS